MNRWAVLAALAALAVLTGCGPATTHPANTGPDGGGLVAGAPDNRDPDVTVEPTGLRIPSIGVSTDDAWVPLGIQGQDGLPVTTKAGEIETPDVRYPKRLGWYCPLRTETDPFPAVCGAPEPGRAGAGVVLGHINGNGQPGIFAKLAQVKVGDMVEVDRADKKTAAFRVSNIQVVDKTRFPSGNVYLSFSDKPVLRLISCGGRLDKIHKRYLDQVVVYADLVEMKPTRP